MNGLDRVENENDIRHYKNTYIERRMSFLAARAITERVF